MNEEIEYAEMLEIPVSTVNVLRGRNKKSRNPFKKQTAVKREKTAHFCAVLSDYLSKDY